MHFGIQVIQRTRYYYLVQNVDPLSRSICFSTFSDVLLQKCYTYCKRVKGFTQMNGKIKKK